MQYHFTAVNMKTVKKFGGMEKKGARAYLKNTPAFMLVEGVNKTKNRVGILPVILELNINQYFWNFSDRNRCANMPE
jgi:hypothetical protein